MYTSNKRQRKHRVFLKFILFVLPFIVLLGLLVWYVFFRPTSSSSNFSKTGAEIAVVKPEVKDYNTDLFKVTLPSSWEMLGKKNPYSDQVYYEFHSTQKDYDNRWLKVYVDIFPKDFAINRLLPVTMVSEHIVPGVLSDECNTFTGAPLPGALNKPTTQTWAAKWQGVDFICDMANPQNVVGTASSEEGYGISLASKSGTKHKYFFVYIDHNVRPDYSVLTDAIKSFETL